MVNKRDKYYSIIHKHTCITQLSRYHTRAGTWHYIILIIANAVCMTDLVSRVHMWSFYIMSHIYTLLLICIELTSSSTYDYGLES
jgi:hypothetical protein